MTFEDIEVTVGTDYSAVKDCIDQYGGDDWHAYHPYIPYLPGDSFYFHGLPEKPGLSFIEAKAQQRPPYDEREEEDKDLDAEIKVVVHASVSIYGNDKDDLEKVMSDVNAWIVGVYKNKKPWKRIKVSKQEIVRSEQAFHEINLTILIRSWETENYIKVKDSVFYETFWNKHMDKIVREGVCYASKKIPDDLITKLKANIDELGKKTPIDFHPKSNDIVRDLVHPALYPYIKGVSQLNKKAKIPKGPRDDESTDFWGRQYEDSKFQWLPTPFEISAEKKVKIPVYINNLNRELFPELYENLENLFEIFLPFFEEVWSYSKAVKFFTEDEGKEYVENEILDKEKISFAGRELQVIVKIVDYTLQPGQDYEGVWHAEGMSHENIVMTGIYFLDRTETLSGGDLRFKRAFTENERAFVFGEINQNRPKVVNEFAKEGFVPLGHFPTDEGYMLVFPNCHIHKISKMINTSSNDMASRRIVVFFVVNPDRRIISTREVSPQQNVISLATAKDYRLQLMEERKYDKEKLNVRDIELCEH